MRFRRRDNLPAFAVIAQIVGSGVEYDAHELILAGLFGGDEYLALTLEHPGDTALLAEVAAVFREHVANFTHGAIAVVGGDHHQNGGAARAVAFEHDLVDLPAFELAGASHDGFLDVVGGHTDALRRGDRGAQPGIHIRIPPVTGRDHNLFNNAREALPALCIGGGFLVLDCRPLG